MDLMPQQARKRLGSAGLQRARVLTGGVPSYATARGIGAGLTFSAATNSCAMGRALSWMPWNRSPADPTKGEAFEQLSRRS